MFVACVSAGVMAELSCDYGTDIAASGRMYPLSPAGFTCYVSGFGACAASLVEEIMCESIDTSMCCE